MRRGGEREDLPILGRVDDDRPVHLARRGAQTGQTVRAADGAVDLCAPEDGHPGLVQHLRQDAFDDHDVRREGGVAVVADVGRPLELVMINGEDPFDDLSPDPVVVERLVVEEGDVEGGDPGRGRLAPDHVRRLDDRHAQAPASCCDGSGDAGEPPAGDDHVGRARLDGRDDGPASTLFRRHRGAARGHVPIGELAESRRRPCSIATHVRNITAKSGGNGHSYPNATIPEMSACAGKSVACSGSVPGRHGSIVARARKGPGCAS